MPAIISLIGSLFTFVGRIFFIIKDFYNIFKWNLLFLVRVIEDFFPYLGKIGKWLFEFLLLIPGRFAEGSLIQIAKWINLAVASSCCGFLADAVSFPSVVSSISGLAYWTYPWRLQYGIGIIICALSIRFVLRHVPSVPSARLPRLPGPKGS